LGRSSVADMPVLLKFPFDWPAPFASSAASFSHAFRHRVMFLTIKSLRVSS